MSTASLLERRPQLDALAAYALEAAAGDGRLVLVAGEAGVGKTALLEAAEERVCGCSGSWAWGRCDGQFTPRPLGPVLEVAERLGGPAWAAVVDDAPPQRLFGAVLEGLRAPGPTTVVLEDLHWADAATLDLVRYLGRRLHDVPALVVVTYRDDALGTADPLRITLGDLAGQRSTRRIDLPPLSEAAVADLSEGSTLDPVELHRLTGGNPFFVGEVLRSGSVVVPASARDAVLARAAGLDESARQALDVAALAGTRVAPDLLLAASAGTVRDLDELVSCGLFVGDGTGLRFRHDIARRAVDEAVTPHRRAAAHRALLDELLRGEVRDDARLAYHAEHAGDEDRALRYARAAGDRAVAKGAHREAAAQYQRAVRVAARLEGRELALLLDALATELTFVDAWEESAAARRRAVETWRVIGDRVREGDDLRRLSGVMWRLCRGAEMDAATTAAVEVLEPLGPTIELGWAYLYAAIGGGDPATRRADLRRAEEVTEAVEDQVPRNETTHLRGQVLMARAELGFRVGDPWEAPLRTALNLGLDSGIEQLTSAAYSNLHQLLVMDYRFRDADVVFEAGVTYTDDRDITTYSTCLRGRRSLALVARGRWSEAERTARVVLRSVASPVNLLTSQVAAGLVRGRRGDPDPDDLLAAAAEAATALGEAEWLALVQSAVAEVAWLSGDSAAAGRAIATARARVRPVDVIEDATLAVWEARLGVSTPDGRFASSPAVPEPLRLHADGAYADAARAWDVAGCAYDAALALLDEGSERALRDALARFESLGAAPAAALTRRRLRASGARSVPSGARPSTRGHPAGLTAREREVLDLLVAGCTNEEISARLVISVRTVDHHVSAVLAKLGAANRRAAVDAASRLGLVTVSR